MSIRLTDKNAILRRLLGKVFKLGGRHSSVASSAPTIL